MNIPASSIYILCALTALICAFLHWRSWRETRLNLLFWSALCFTFLTVNNVLLFVDLVVFPTADLALWRSSSMFVGVGLLLFGMIWERR